MGCFVCESPVLALDEHHVVMRAQGGEAGPTVLICPTCHSTIHRASHRMMRGKSHDDLIAHLDHDAKGRANVLVKVIVAVEAGEEDRKNPNPLVTVKLDHHLYLVGLKLLQKDRGFSSREAMLNELLRQIAIQYGLFDDVKTNQRLKTLREVRGNL